MKLHFGLPPDFAAQCGGIGDGRWRPLPDPRLCEARRPLSRTGTRANRFPAKFYVRRRGVLVHEAAGKRTQSRRHCTRSCSTVRLLSNLRDDWEIGDMLERCCVVVRVINRMFNGLTNDISYAAMQVRGQTPQTLRMFQWIH